MPKKLVYRRDYRPHPYAIPQTKLDFTLDAAKTLVEATSVVQRRSLKNVPLVLDGRSLALKAVEINGVPLKKSDYQQTAEQLIIKTKALPRGKRSFTLRITTIIHPAQNLALEGLYQSGNILCTRWKVRR